jgi:hypothetical protein
MRCSPLDLLASADEEGGEDTEEDDRGRSHPEIAGSVPLARQHEMLSLTTTQMWRLS